jgi:hypothetical protein
VDQRAERLVHRGGLFRDCATLIGSSRRDLEDGFRTRGDLSVALCPCRRPELERFRLGEASVLVLLRALPVLVAHHGDVVHLVPAESRELGASTPRAVRRLLHPLAAERAAVAGFQISEPLLALVPQTLELGEDGLGQCRRTDDLLALSSRSALRSPGRS